MADCATEDNSVQIKGTSLDPSSYLLYAGDNGPAWNDIVGQLVTHAKFGRGRVVRVRQRAGYALPAVLYVQFEGEGEEERDRQFPATSFGEGVFTEVVIPDALAALVLRGLQHRRADEQRRAQEERERRRQQELEADARRHFASLRKKYRIGPQFGDSPVSPLYRILLVLEDDGALADEDIEWLQGNGLYEVLAMMYEGRYSRSRDQWDLVLASSNWQHAAEYERAFAITERATSGDRKLMGAILTTRGRAYRNLLSLDEAESCARDAIALNPTSFYAYNLLGAIYYQRGYPADGDEQFEKALELGASEKGMDGEIKAAVRIAGREQQREVAKFLLGKDPLRYQWAKHYL